MSHFGTQTFQPNHSRRQACWASWSTAIACWLISLATAAAVAAAQEIDYRPDDANLVGDYVDYSASYAGSCDCGCGAAVSCRPLAGLFSTSGTSWIQLEYLDWTTEGSDLPPLLRSSPTGTSPDQTGLLNRPGQTLFGGDSADIDQSGVRLSGGWWFDHSRTVGIELSYAALPQSSDTYRFDSLSFPHLARPVFDTETGSEAAMLIAHPDFLSGRASIRQTNEFHHLEALRRDVRFQDRCRRLETLIGLRYASLEDSLLISQSSLYTAANGVILPGSQRELFDRFEATNRFHGVVLGLDYSELVGILQLHGRITLGLGNNHTELLVDGRTQTTVPGDGSAIFDGGLLAQRSNIGLRSRNRFAVMPEAYLGVSAQLNRCWQLKAGYQLIYWDQAAQAASQIDRRVSQYPPEPVTGQGAPSARLRSSDVLIHGLQVGASLTF